MGCSLELTLADDVAMMPLNKKFMGKRGTTDVLSFPAQNAGPKVDYTDQYLGEIFISLDQANRQAEDQDLSLKQEVIFLIIHSILHLIGYDHQKKSDRLKMQAMESLLIKKIMLV